MMIKYYIAIASIEPNEKLYSIVFPNFPGITSVAEKYSDIMTQASDALASMVEAMEAADEALPPAKNDGEFPPYLATGSSNQVSFLVPVEVSGKLTA